MLKKIILFLIISLFSLFSLFLIFNISKQNNLSSNSFYNTNQSKDYTPDPYIDYVSDDFNTSDGEDYIFISVYFNDDDYVEDHVEDIQVKFTGIEEPVKYNQHASSANGIAITSNWKYLNNNYVTYKFSYLEPHTVYHMEYISIDDDPDTWTSVDTTFSYIEDDYIESINLVDDKTTSSSVQIKVRFVYPFVTSIPPTTTHEEDLEIQLEGYTTTLTLTHSINDITLTYDGEDSSYTKNKNNKEMYYEQYCLYTISGLRANDTYEITKASIDGEEFTYFDLSFTTKPVEATVDSIQVVDDSITDSSVQIKVTTSTTNFDENNLVLHLEGHDGDLTTSTPVDGITLTHDSTNETEIIYTISGLESNTEYTITSAKLNGISTNNIDLSFTTLISPAEVTNIEVINESITDSSAQIKVTTSTTRFDIDDLVLYLDGYSNGLTTSTPIDGITLTHDSTNETEIYYTISGLESNTEYTITSAELNGISTNDIDLSFTTLITPAEVTNIEIVDDSVTNSSVQIKVTTSTTRFDVDDLVLHLEGHDGGLTTLTPIDGITLTHDSTNETEIYYTISGLESNTEYTITSAELNGISTNDIDLSFTTLITPAEVTNIEIVDDSVTNSSVQIKVTTSTTRFDVDDLVLHLEGHDGGLTTSTPIDGITLTHDSTDETEIIYTISGLTQNTQYTITSAELNGISKNNIDLSFTTLISLAEVTNIEIVNGTITDSSVQIKVTTSTTNFNADDLALHLSGYDDDLTTSNPIDGITLTYDSTDETEIIYTISGLDSNTQYTITSAELNDISTNDIDLSFTTLETPATVNSIEIIDESITDSSAQIKVTTSTTRFDVDDLVLHLEGHDGDLTTSNPVDGITLTHDSTNETEIYYTISGLTQNTQYTITSAELNGTETTVDVSFTTEITLAVINSIELVDDSITDSSAQIKVTTSTTNFNADDLVLHLEGHDGDLTTSNPIDGITLTHDSTNETEIYYTISGLTQNTQYTITSAKLNGISTNNIDLSFTTLISPAEVTNIEIVDGTITDSSVQIKVTTSTTRFDVDDLVLHLEGHDGDLTTSTPINGITLTHDSTDEIEIIYTISGLAQETQYTITSAELNGTETTVDVSFTTAISLAIINTVEVVSDSITDSSAQIKVTTSTTNFNADNLILHLAGHDGDLTTSTPVDEITLTHDSTNETEIIYTISGLAQNTQYTITSVELNGTETTVDVSFTTGITFAVVNSIELVDDSVTDSSAQIKVTTSTTRFDVDDLVLHLEGHDGDLMTSTPVDGITLTYDSLDETEIIYTISGLAQNTQYTITSAELNGISTNDIDLSFTTLETPAIVNSIEIIDESITDSSAQIKVVTSTTSFDENDLILHLDGHNGDLTTSTPVDGITLTYDSINETKLYTQFQD
ncbi:MAG: hypothetical protein TYPL_3940 [Candidatus Tyloplasma litorale]|nr:MAG: hypothetical protein TYPL_3940 [Mycoplasmatales bacterium]